MQVLADTDVTRSNDRIESHDSFLSSCLTYVSLRLAGWKNTSNRFPNLWNGIWAVRFEFSYLMGSYSWNQWTTIMIVRLSYFGKEYSLCLVHVSGKHWSSRSWQSELHYTLIVTIFPIDWLTNSWKSAYNVVATFIQLNSVIYVLPQLLYRYA